MPRFIRAIRDVHTDPAARMLAETQLLSGDIKVFFMEWSEPVHAPLNECFKKLNANDASPTLLRLAEICTSRRIDVVACDLDPETTSVLLNSNIKDPIKNTQHAVPDPYAGTYASGSAVQPWGKAVRDRYAAGVVGLYMNTHPDAWDQALLMYGADHFRHEEGRNAPGLHMLIELQFADGNIQFLN